MSALDVRPERLWRRPGEEVVILVDCDRAVEGTVVVTRLGDEILRRSVALVGGRQRVPIGPLEEGAYGLELHTAGASGTTAFDVLRGLRSMIWRLPTWGVRPGKGPQL